jgi:GNAT superfamily N-acetyltransferase
VSVVIRRCREDEDFQHLTALIHRAYAPLAAAGMRYWATHQSVADTIQRCGRGETWLAEAGGDLAGTVTLQPPDQTSGSPWYDRPEVAKFQQFAVDPAWQGRGVGAALMAHIESRARELGARELALDTSEHAEGLITLYARRGYRFIEHVDWRPDVNYRSVLLSLAL